MPNDALNLAQSALRGALATAELNVHRARKQLERAEATYSEAQSAMVEFLKLKYPPSEDSPNVQKPEALLNDESAGS